MRKLFISTLALIIGLAFTVGAFGEMEGATGKTPAEKHAPKMAQKTESPDSKVVDTKSASSKKKLKKVRKGKTVNKEAAPAQ